MKLSTFYFIIITFSLSLNLSAQQMIPMIHDTVVINAPDSTHNIVIESEKWRCIKIKPMKDSALYFTSKVNFDNYVQNNWIETHVCSEVPKIKIDFDKFDCFVVCIPCEGYKTPDYKCDVYKKNNHYTVFIHLFVSQIVAYMREYFIRYFLLPKGELMPPEIHYLDDHSSIKK